MGATFLRPTIAAISAGTAVATAATVVFSNSNNVSFGVSGQTVTASYTVPAVTNSSATVSAGASSETLSNLVFANSNSVTFGLSQGTVTASVPTQSVQTQNVVVPAGSNTTYTSGTVIFTGSNAVTVRSTTGQAIVIDAPVQTSVVFSNSNNVTFGLNGSTLTASASYSQSTGPAALVAGTQTATSGTVSFADSNGISFGMSGSTRITASYTVPTVPAQLSVGVSTGGNTAGDTGVFTGRVVFAGGNNVTLSGSSNGGSATYTISGPNTFAQFSAGVSTGGNTAGDTGLFTGRVVLAGGPNITVSGSSNGGSYTISISGPAAGGQTNQTLGLYAVDNTVGQSSSTTLDARTITLNGLGIITVGYSNGSVQLSASQSVQTQSLIAGVYDGANSISTGTIRFTNANGVSFSINGQTLSASVAAQSVQTQSLIAGLYDGANSITTGTARFTNANGVSFSINGQTISASIAPRSVRFLHIHDAPWQTNFNISNASYSVQHFNPRADITASQANFLMALSGNSDSTGALTISIGAYTMNGSTMSLASSDSRSFSWTSGSQTTASSRYGGQSGTMYRTISLANWGFTAGDYMIGIWFRTTNDGTWRAFGTQGPTIVNALDAAETNHYHHGFSTSSYTTAMAASINVTDTNFVRTGGDALKHAGVVFLGTY